MTFEIFNKIVNEQKNKNSILFDLENDRIVSNNKISKIEKIYHLILPENYKRFIRKYGGGYFGFTTVLSCDSNGDFYILSNVSIKFVEENNFLPLIDLETGDMLGVKVLNKYCEDKMYLYSHDTNTLIFKNCDFLEAVLNYGLKIFL